MAAETAPPVREAGADPGKKVAEALLVAILAVLAHASPVTAGAEPAQVVSVMTAAVRALAVAVLR